MNDKIVNLKPFLDILRDAEAREYFDEMEALEREHDEQTDLWEQHLIAKGLDRDGPPDPDGGFVSVLDREVNRIMVEFDELVSRQVQDQEDAISALAEIRRALELQPSSAQSVQQETAEKVLRDPHPDEPLSLFEAVCLPELGGKLFEGDEGSVGKFSVKTLRTEIAAKRLRRVPPLNKNIYVSRKTLKLWMETEWQDQENHHIFYGSNPSTTKPQASSGRKVTGPSQTEPPELAQASALTLVSRLRQHGSRTK